jgi:NAD+ synthase
MEKMRVGLQTTFDAGFEIGRIENFIQSNIERSHARGVIVGISGGVDSAVAAALCRKAIGSRRVMGLLLFEQWNIDSADYKDAKKLISVLGIRSVEIPLSPHVELFRRALLSAGVKKLSRVTLGNIKARLRMIFLYSFANQENLLVAGTGDRSESLIGYFTKYGDGAADFFPIGHLYKSEIRILAEKLGIPQSIVSKPSSPALWRGHKATDEIPADYSVLDSVFREIFDLGQHPSIAAKRLGVPQKTIQDVNFLNLKSAHKREMPKTLMR